MVVRTPRVQMPQTGRPTPINLTRMSADDIYCVNVTCIGRIGQTALPLHWQAMSRLAGHSTTTPRLSGRDPRHDRFSATRGGVGH